MPRPVYRPWLLLQDPPPAIRRTSAIQIMMKSCDVGMALACVSKLPSIRKAERLKKSERVTVPSDRVEIGPAEWRAGDILRLID
jgi:hypothetical protein